LCFYRILFGCLLRLLGIIEIRKQSMNIMIDCGVKNWTNSCNYNVCIFYIITILLCNYIFYECGNGLSWRWRVSKTVRDLFNYLRKRSRHTACCRLSHCTDQQWNIVDGYYIIILIIIIIVMIELRYFTVPSIKTQVSRVTAANNILCLWHWRNFQLMFWIHAIGDHTRNVSLALM